MKLPTKMERPWNFRPFADEVPADMALRIAGRVALGIQIAIQDGDEDAGDKLDDNILKAMLVQLDELGVEAEEIRQYRDLDVFYRIATSG